jgi:hypothetical protein
MQNSKKITDLMNKLGKQNSSSSFSNKELFSS